MELVNLSEIVSAGNEETLWSEIQTYRDPQHVREYTNTMENTRG
jgi:hypothetical protein